MKPVEIGNPRGRIALLLDDTEAIELAEHYGPGDLAYRELMEAVEKAYPPPSDEPQLGLRSTVTPKAELYRQQAQQAARSIEQMPRYLRDNLVPPR